MSIRMQKGFTLVEISIVMLIVGILFSGLVTITKTATDDRNIINDAELTRSIGEAATSYIQDNYSALIGVATPTSPALITIPMLIATNNLNAGTASTNFYNQNICVLVKEPVAGKLQALLVTEGGDAINDIDVGFYAGNIGGLGGFIRSTSADTINGVGGSWSLNTSDFDNLVNDAGTSCDGTAGNVQLEAGHVFMALWFSSQNNTSGMLYRDSIPSRPELNRMNTALDMNGNDVNNANSVNATTDVSAPVFIDSDNVAFQIDPSGNSVINTMDVASINASGNIVSTGSIEGDTLKASQVVNDGDACTDNGTIAQDATGKILSCQSSIWSSLGGGGDGIGVGQTWQDLTASRSYGVPYVNDTGRPIMITMTCQTSSGASSLSIQIGAVSKLLLAASAANMNGGFTYVIPAGETYMFSASSMSMRSWLELR